MVDWESERKRERERSGAANHAPRARLCLFPVGRARGANVAAAF